VFTGIIETVGTVTAVTEIGTGRRLTVRAEGFAEKTVPGESIAVAGACLTVAGGQETEFTADVSPETLRVTTLGELAEGDSVNLERALRADGRLGGHFVLGHIDTVGTLKRIIGRGEFTEILVDLPEEFRRFVVPKGSIAVDGVSLTIAEKFESGFSVALIPVTLAETTFGRKRVGDRVNLETDIIGKYVWNYIQAGNMPNPRDSALTMDTLRAAGFMD